MRASDIKKLIIGRIANLESILKILKANQKTPDVGFELNYSDYYARIEELKGLLEKMNDKPRKDKQPTEGQLGASTNTGGDHNEQSLGKIPSDS